MSTPVTSMQTVQVIDDAIAFEKAADRAGLASKDARRLAATLGELPADQARRICIAALEQRRRTEANTRRRKAR